jgi:hypothetical protein
MSFLFKQSQAQQIAPEVSAHFPASVVVRVYEVASKVSLNAQKQKTLAIFFQLQDSLMAEKIKKGAASSAIDSIEAGSKTALQMILSPKELEEYYNGRLGNDAKTEGRLMGKLLQLKYGCDTALQNILGALYYKRKLSADKVLLQFSDAATQEKQLGLVLSKYDSLIEKYIHAASSSSFLKEKMKVLNSIKPLSEKEQSSLTNRFLTLCAKHPDKSFTDNFEEALPAVLTDTTYYAFLYKEEIGKRAASNANMSAGYLIRKNRITKEGMNSIYPVMLEREKVLATLSAAYPLYTKAKDSLITQVNTHYDSLIDVALMRDGATLPNSQFAIAIQYRRALELTGAQVDSLLAKAVLLKKSKEEFSKEDPFGKYDSKAFESEHMTRILTEDQYSKVLLIKNKSQAKGEAEQDWKELEQRGLSAEYNKENTLKQLNNYYLAKWCAYYRYGNDKIKQSANVKSIEEKAPKALKALKAARKYNNPADPVKGSYQW